MTVGQKAEGMDELSDRKYPQVEEIEQFIWLVKAIKKTYQFTLPDKSKKCNQKFENFIPCSKLIDQLRFNEKSQPEAYKLNKFDLN